MGKSYWEKTYQTSYTSFLETIIESKPDFIVPVARKSIKLMDAIQHNFGEFQEKIRYIDYFDFKNLDLSKSRVVIFDDAVRTASTLRRYRNYFESYLPHSPMEVLTYGFIGHKQLITNPEINQEKDVNIFIYKSEASYLEYSTQQAEFLIRRGTQPDIDHMVIEFEISDLGTKVIQKLWEFLPSLGYSYKLEPVSGTDRVGLHSPFFFPFDEILNYFNLNIKRDFVEKIKFCHLKDINKCHTIPLYFPTLYTPVNEKCNLTNLIKMQLPFKLPCQYREEHNVDKICYQSICLVLNSLFARSFFLTLREKFKGSELLSGNISLRRKDIVRYLGNEIGNELVTDIEEFVKADNSPLDKLILRNNTERKYYTLPHLDLPINRENIPAIFKEMREGYVEEVRKSSDSPVDVRFTKSPDEMMLIGGGTHPLIFTEVLDEYCDEGALVPVTVYNEEQESWSRVYRTGECPADYFSWERTKYIIPFAIEELAQNGGVHRMLLEKALTNFVFDFPYPELHSLGERESLWGPQTFAYYKLKNVEIPIDRRDLKYERLYDWRNLAEYFDYDPKRQIYVRKNKPFINATKYFNNDTLANETELRQYFQIFFHLCRRFGNSNFIYSLAICRESQTFLRYLLKSIQIWLSAYKVFLDDFYYEKINTEILTQLGNAAKSSRDKVRYAQTFKEDFKKAGDFILEGYPKLHKEVWLPKIEENINWELQPLIKYPEVHLLTNVTDGLSLLFEITRLKLGEKIKIKDRKKVESRVGEDGEGILKRVGISNKILHWPESNDKPSFESAYNELTEALSQLKLMVNNIKLDNTPSTSRREWLEKREEMILVNSNPEPPEDISSIINAVIARAKTMELLNPEIEGMSDLIDGQHDGNKLVYVHSAKGQHYLAEVIIKDKRPYVQNFQKVNSQY
ncbi:MAG: hypothetical protein HPY72_11455 [Anaerolineae bacterium]|nr:hypothetical protein [Anaerolineae bacterium]